MKLPIIVFVGLKANQKDALRSALSDLADPRFESGCAEISGRIGQDSPVLVLIGSDLPGQDPVELAMSIRALHKDVKLGLFLPIGHPAFATTLTETDEIWCDAGVQDLARRVTGFVRGVVEVASLRESGVDNMRVAMTAMSSMGELGVVLRFLSDCFHKSDHSQVGAAVLESLAAYSLSGCCQLRGQGFCVTAVTEGESRASCEAIIAKLCNVGRILEFKNRMIVNYPNVSILMSNVPEDAEIRGRIRDNVAMLAEGAQARIISLILESENIRKRDGIHYALAEIREMAADFAMAQKEAFHSASNAINETLGGFSDTFVSLGLTDYQEGMLLDMVASLRAKIEKFHAISDGTMSKMAAVTQSLQELEGV